MKLSQLLPLYGLSSFVLAADQPSGNAACPVQKPYDCGKIDIFKGQLDKLGIDEDELFDLGDTPDELDKRARWMSPRYQRSLLELEDDDDEFNSTSSDQLFERATNPPAGNPPAGNPRRRKPRRSRRTTKFGNNFMKYKTPTYVKEPLVELQVDDWADCGDFTLKRKERKAGTPKTKTKDDAHRLDSEHVLERHMLQKFFGAKVEGKWPKWIGGTGNAPGHYQGDYQPQKPFDDDAGKWQDMCQMLHHYWAAPERVFKSTKKPEAFVDATVRTKTTKMYSWDAAALGWPNKQQGSEMLLLTHPVNGMKSLMFQPDVRMRNLDALEKLETKQADAKSPDLTKEELDSLFEERQGYVASLRVGVMVNQYMKMDEVKKTYKLQVERVIKSIKDAETGIVNNYKSTKDAKGPYKTQKLGEKYEAWIKTDTTASIKKLKDFMLAGMKWMEESVKAMKQVEDDHKKDPKKPALLPNDAKLKTNMEKTIVEIKKIETNNGWWTSPL
ncbi:hypothetical protein PG987_006497 [Apiospora arundinis]